MRIVIIEFMSLDGVVQAPGGPDEDTDGGFRHGGWQVPYGDQDLGKWAGEGMAATDAFLFGRKTKVGGLKDQPGQDIGVLGSGQLVQTLIENDLVDEYSLAVFPIVLGSGKTLFRDARQTKPLRLVDSRTTGTGGLLLTYQPMR